MSILSNSKSGADTQDFGLLKKKTMRRESVIQNTLRKQQTMRNKATQRSDDEEKVDAIKGLMAAGMKDLMLDI